MKPSLPVPLLRISSSFTDLDSKGISLKCINTITYHTMLNLLSPSLVKNAFTDSPFIAVLKLTCQSVLLFTSVTIQHNQLLFFILINSYWPWFNQRDSFNTTFCFSPTMGKFSPSFYSLNRQIFTTVNNIQDKRCMNNQNSGSHHCSLVLWLRAL